MAKPRKPRLPGTKAGRVLNTGYEDVGIDKIEPHPRNPRKGNINIITESIDTNGFYGAVVVQKSTNFILAGNHRYLAAKQAHWDTVPVIWVDCDDKAATRILLSDNRTSDIAGYDDKALGEILAELAAEDDLVGTGFDHKDLTDLLDELGVATPEPEDMGGDASIDEVQDGWGVIVVCKGEEEQLALLARLMEEGHECRALIQ